MTILHKSSRFNFWIPIPEKNIALLYNTFAGSLYELTWEEYTFVLPIMERDEFDLSAIHSVYPQVADKLFEGKCIVPGDIDQKASYIEAYNSWHERNFTNSGEMVLTLTPTLACNLACRYCFQNGAEAQTMKRETFNEVLKFMEQRIIESGGNQANNKFFNMTWFGGEPTMVNSCMEEYTNDMKDLCKKYDYTYKSGIVTNGTLLTKEIWDLFERCSIGHVQITLDGPAETHDIRRPAKSGKDNYYAIIKNIQSLPEDISMTIRINTDKQVWSKIDILLDDLYQAGVWPQRAKSVNLALAFVCQYENSRHRDQDWYFTQDEFYQIEADFVNKKFAYYNSWADENSIKRAKKVFSLPKIDFAECRSAVYKNGFVIDPQGYLHKCWETVDKQNERLGHVSEPLDIENNKFTPWTSYSKITNSQCLDCICLPVCEVHCTVKMTRDFQNRKCSKWKNRLVETLRQQYTEMLDNSAVYATIK